jgi:hypothetical protein
MKSEGFGSRSGTREPRLWRPVMQPPARTTGHSAGPPFEQSTVAVDKFVGNPAPMRRERRQFVPCNGMPHF